MTKPTSRVTKVHVAGPLAPFAAPYRSRLNDLGYTPLTAVSMMRLIAHLSRWLDAAGKTVADLTSERIEQYFGQRRAIGQSAWRTPRSLAVFLEVLGTLGVLPAPMPEASPSEVGALLVTFRAYLLDERALTPKTAEAYVDTARRFLNGSAHTDPAELTAGDVTRAVLSESGAWSVGSTQYFVTAMRSFLRFCFIEGLVEVDLSAAALSTTGRRRSGLPNGISRSDAQALLSSCDRRRSDGRRDYAIVTTLLRLGLRAGEVAALSLDDIDWRAGEMVVHGKARRHDRLPLPVDVGEAIAAYLRRGRPKTTGREVFLRAVAPIAPLGRSGVSAVVRRACIRAGVTPVGAHRLRHTLACEMVAMEVPLPEISQVLRHRSLTSTAIYARVDIAQLRSLAQPWPGGGER